MDKSSARPLVDISGASRVPRPSAAPTEIPTYARGPRFPRSGAVVGAASPARRRPPAPLRLCDAPGKKRPVARRAHRRRVRRLLRAPGARAPPDGRPRARVPSCPRSSASRRRARRRRGRARRRRGRGGRSRRRRGAGAVPSARFFGRVHLVDATPGGRLRVLAAPRPCLRSAHRGTSPTRASPRPAASGRVVAVPLLECTYDAFARRRLAWYGRLPADAAGAASPSSTCSSSRPTS